MKHTVFIDGRQGTTGLKIEERLTGHPAVELLSIPEEKRKDAAARRECINAADIVFLCLPDAAARESVSLVENAATRLIDASTAHRTDPGWAYGLPELGPAHRERIAGARFVSVPGCYATCFALLVYPLVKEGVVGADYPLAVNAVTGYSGGGRELIAKYEDPNRAGYYASARHYALGMAHKHLPEMRVQAGLAHAPAFNPILGDFRQGMAMAVPVLSRLMKRKLGVAGVHALLSKHYAGQRFVRVTPLEPGAGLDDGGIDPTACNGTNFADLYALGNDEQALLASRLDNLGKGSSGAAVQCMNIMLGLDEEIGL